MQQSFPAPSIDSNFGRALATIRDARNLSQRAFADRLSERGVVMDASAVSRIEQGKRPVRLSEAVVMADILDVGMNQLLGIARTPESELVLAQRKLSAVTDDARGPIVQLINSALEVRDLLHEYPHLVHLVKDPVVGDLSSFDEFFDWLKQRMTQDSLELLMARVYPEVMAFPGQIDAVIDLVAHLARTMLPVELQESHVEHSKEA
ncbi:helix-turn-helix domain-containing protein [Herbiconiux sp. CPCC 203386]|uniref:Helix-turn-helix domain-containing protein n=2 Tax=Herbiconiux daphne TaxID=2970914 RepID=A0ABT2GWN5_9MICO|nr:helix-turn-helix domain-containing protein [Herbiconiux daphne]